MNTLISIATTTRTDIYSIIAKNQQAFDKDYTGSCLVCSWLLTKILKDLGYNAELAIGEFKSDCHAFVVVDNKIIVDITATQFGLPAVYITNISNNKYIIRLRGRRCSYDLKYWPREQKPSSYKEELNEIYKKIMRGLKVVNKKAA